MLKRLRTAHPILYCILSEVLFLGSMVVFSLLATIGLAAAGADFDTMDGYLLGLGNISDVQGGKMYNRGFFLNMSLCF